MSSKTKLAQSISKVSLENVYFFLFGNFLSVYLNKSVRNWKMYPANCPELNIRKFCLKCFKSDDESNNNNLSENYKEKSVTRGIFDRSTECFETNCPCFYRKRRQIGVINDEQSGNNHTPIIPITIAPEP